MLKKAKAQLAAGESGAANEKGKETAKDLAQGVLDSSHQIWLAGLRCEAQGSGSSLRVTIAVGRRRRASLLPRARTHQRLGWLTPTR